MPTSTASTLLTLLHLTTLATLTTSTSTTNPLLQRELTTLSSTETKTITLPAPTSPLSPSYTNPTTLQLQTLNSTNLYRYEHASPFLTWNSTLATYAHSWASNCLWQHSHGPYGENLAIGYPSLSLAIDAWGDERAHYDFHGTQTGFTEQTGHFTQLVWKSTTSTGCAAVDCEGKNGLFGVLVVCEYWPAGNVVGDDDRWFEENVQKQVNQGQGYAGVTAVTSGGGTTATNTMGGANPTNTMGAAATGVVVGGSGSRGWWAIGATVAAFVLAGGMI